MSKHLITLLLTFVSGFFSSQVLAHATAVNADFKRLGNQLNVYAIAAEGYGIPNMQLSITLSRNGTVLLQSTLKESSKAVYTVQIPNIADGQLRLALEDTTPGFIPVKAEQVVQWRDDATFQMVLPPSPTAGPEVTVLILLALLPIAIAFAALGVVVLMRSKGRNV